MADGVTSAPEVLVPIEDDNKPRKSGELATAFLETNSTHRSNEPVPTAKPDTKELSGQTLDEDQAALAFETFFDSEFGQALLADASDPESFRAFAAEYLVAGGAEAMQDPEVLARIDELGAALVAAGNGDYSALPDIIGVDAGTDFVAYASQFDAVVLDLLMLEEVAKQDTVILEAIGREIGHWMSHQINGDVDQVAADGGAFDEGDAVFQALGGVVDDAEINSDDHEIISLSLDGGPAVDVAVERFDRNPDQATTVAPEVSEPETLLSFTVTQPDGSVEIINVPPAAGGEGELDPIAAQIVADVEIPPEETYARYVKRDPVITDNGDGTGTVSVTILRLSTGRGRPTPSFHETVVVDFKYEGTANNLETVTQQNFTVTDLDGSTEIVSVSPPMFGDYAINQVAAQIVADIEIPESDYLNRFHKLDPVVTDNGDGTGTVTVEVYRLFFGYGEPVENLHQTFTYDFKYEGTSNASETGSEPPVVLLSEQAELNMNDGDTEIRVNVLENDPIDPEDIESFEAVVTSGGAYVAVEFDDSGNITVTPQTGAGIPPQGVQVQVQYTVENKNGSTSTSNLNVTIYPPSTGVPTTVTEANSAPDTSQNVNISSQFANSKNAYVLWRADDTSEWVQIASQHNGHQIQSSFVVDNNVDLAGGEYAMFTDTGSNTGRTHNLVGTTTAAPAGAVYTPTVSSTPAGATNIEFRSRHGNDTAMPEVSITLSKTAPYNATGSLETDPTDPPVPVHDYKFTYTFDYMEEIAQYAGFGSVREVPQEHTFTVSISASEITPGMTQSQLVALADSKRTDVFQDWADDQAQTITGGETSVSSFTESDHTGFSTSTGYDSQNVALVGFGTNVSPTPGVGSDLSAFFIQGDNEIISGRQGDTLGNIWLETYTPEGGSDVSKVPNDVTFDLTSAFAVGPDGVPIDLGDKFFIRKTLGDEGKWDIGLEGDQSILASEFAGQTIVLRVQAIDEETGAVYETSLYFNPESGVLGGQRGTSQEWVQIFNEETNGSASVSGSSASFWSSENGEASADIDNQLDSWTLYGSNFNAYNGSGLSGSRILRDGELSYNTDQTSAEVDFEGFGLSFTGEEEDFSTGWQAVTIAGGTLSTQYEYYHEDFNRTSDRVKGTVTKDADITAATIDPTSADAAFFNEHFEVKVVDGEAVVVQTKYFDPTSRGPVNVKFNVTFEGGAGSATFDYQLNTNAIKFPGKEIEEALENPTIEEATAASTDVFAPALTDENGDDNVQILGVDVTQQVLSTLVTDLGGVANELYGDEEQLRALGLTDEEIEQVQDSATLYAMQASAPGYVSFDTTIVRPPFELLTGFVTKHEKTAELNTYFETARDKIVSDVFGEGVTAKEVATQMIEMGSGLEVTVIDGIDAAPDTYEFTDLLPPKTALRDNLERMPSAQREEFTQAWLSVAGLIDAETSGAIVNEIAGNDEVLGQAYKTNIGGLFDSADAHVENTTDRMLEYYGGGDTPDEFTEAEIAEILEDPELVDEFLQGFQAMLQLSGAEQFTVGGLDLFANLSTFAAGIRDGTATIAFNNAGTNLTQKQATTRGFLQLVNESGGFAEALFSPSLSTITGAVAGASNVVEDFFDLWAANDIVKADYGANRADSKAVFVNGFVALARLGAVSLNAGLTDDATPVERLTLAIDAATSFGSTKGVLSRLAGLLTTGDAAEHLASGNRYYMLDDTEGGTVKLKASTGVFDAANVVDDYSVDDYNADKQQLSLLRREKIIGSDPSNPEYKYNIYNEDGSRPVDTNGNYEFVTSDQRKALANRVGNRAVHVNTDGTKVVYEKQAASEGLAYWGEQTSALAGSLTTEFTMTDDIARSILVGEKGKLVEVEIPDPTEDDPYKTKKVKVPLYDNLYDKAAAHLFGEEIADAAVGDTVKVSPDGSTDIEIKVTQDLKDLANGSRYSITNEIARTALVADIGDVIEFRVSAPTAADPSATKVVKVTVDQTFQDKALAKLFGPEIENTATGNKVTVSPDGIKDIEITVTKRLKDLAAGDLSAGNLDYSQSGASSNRARLFREFFGLDDYAQGGARFVNAFGRPAEANVKALKGLANRFAEGTAGALQITRGVANSLGSLLDFVGLGLDIYNTVQVFKDDGTNSEKAIAVTSLILGAAGTAVSIGLLFGGAAAAAVLGPAGIALATASIFLALTTPGLLALSPPKEPTALDIYGATAAFLLGVESDDVPGEGDANAFGLNLLAGAPQVDVSPDHTGVTLRNGELLIGTDATVEDLANELERAYEAGEADFLLPLFALTYQFAEKDA